MRTEFYLLAIFLCGQTFADNSDYKGYKVYRIVPETQEQIDFLYDVATSEPNDIDFWLLTKILNKPADVMVAPTSQRMFESDLYSRGISFEVLDSDIPASIRSAQMEADVLRSSTKGVGFTTYHRYDEITEYLEELAKLYPKILTVTEGGKSYENRTIKVLKVSNGISDPKKKIIFVDAGIHAREWIAPASALYIIKQLVENYDNNKDLLEKFDWIILPVVNPDGYEYSHTNDRYWRKTRSLGKSCYGTDGNRNYGYAWSVVGSSSSECSDTFHGTSAFSEVETQLVRDLLLENKDNILFYLTLHTYGDMLLYPWGWTTTTAPTWRDLQDVGDVGAAAIRQKSGNRYSVGNSVLVIGYAIGGASDDYAFSLGIPISFTMELAGGSFNPSASKIAGIAEETWAGVRAMALRVQEKFIN